MCLEICSTLYLCNPDCPMQPSTRGYVLITNIYKAAECICLAQHVSADSATNSAKTEQEVLPHEQERSWIQVGRQLWNGCRDRRLRDATAMLTGLELSHKESWATEKGRELHGTTPRWGKFVCVFTGDGELLLFKTSPEAHRGFKIIQAPVVASNGLRPSGPIQPGSSSLQKSEIN